MNVKYLPTIVGLTSWASLIRAFVSGISTESLEWDAAICFSEKVTKMGAELQSQKPVDINYEKKHCSDLSQILT